MQFAAVGLAFNVKNTFVTHVNAGLFWCSRSHIGGNPFAKSTNRIPAFAGTADSSAFTYFKQKGGRGGLMLKRLLQLLFQPESRQKESKLSPTREEAFRRLGELAPIKALPGAEVVPTYAAQESKGNIGVQQITFVRRQPVLNREQRVAGHAFMLSRPLRRLARQVTLERQRFLDSALINQIAAMHVDELLEHRLAFVQISPASLDLPEIEDLPRSNAVLSIQGSMDEDAMDSVPLLARVEQLHELGFRIACDEKWLSKLPGLLERCQFVVFDVNSTTPAELLDRSKDIHSQNPHVQLIGMNLDSLEDFEICRNLAFSNFQGDFITSREKWTHPQIDKNHAIVISVLNQLRRDGVTNELAQRLKQEPTLSYRLLRHINSAAVGLRYKIASVEQAMMMLGQDSLYRWLTLLLFHKNQPTAFDDALRETALERARLIELLARNRFSGPECDEIFVVGLFSMADALFHAPLGEVLEKITLPVEVTGALLSHSGRYADYLELGIALEKADADRIGEIAGRLGLGISEVKNCQNEMLQWINQFQTEN